MKLVTALYGFLVIAGAAGYKVAQPATGPSGTVCESAGGSCVGVADGTNIAYMGNCSQYIVCFLECGCDMSCPDGLHFNSKLQVCDWPENAGCDSSISTPTVPGSTPGGSGSTPGGSGSTPGGSGSTPGGSGSTPGGSGSTPGGSGSTPGGSGSTPGDSGSTPGGSGSGTPGTGSGPATGPSGTVCESAGGSCVGVEDGKKIPYAGDCNKYVVCFLECGCDMECPDGLYFNPTLQVCDWPENSGCGNSTGTPSTIPTTIGSTTASTTAKTTTPTSTASSTTKSTTPTTTKTTASTTIGSTTASTTAKTTTPTSTASSTTKSTTPITTTGSTTTKTTASTTIKTTTSSSTTSIGGPTAPSQPATGPSGTVCESAGGSCVGVADGTNIAYMGNCSQYIVCFLECGCDMSCPDGLHFNSKLQVCDWPENAGCDSSISTPTVPGSTPGGSGSTPGGSGSTPGGSGSTPGGSGSTPGGSGSTPGGSGSTPGGSGSGTPGTGSGPATGPSGTVCESAGGSCVGVEDGKKIPYAGDCNKYVVCFLECGCDMECPDGLNFNPELQVCDWPENAGCSSAKKLF